LVLAGHPSEARFDAFWLVGGRVADWGALPEEVELSERTAAALARLGGRRGVGTHVPPGEVDEVRIVGNWLASHPQTPALVLQPPPERGELAGFVSRAAGSALCERQRDHGRFAAVPAHGDDGTVLGFAADQGEGDGADAGGAGDGAEPAHDLPAERELVARLGGR